MTTTWDLVVVGAGPAGASAALGALHADPSLRVLLLDRADFPRDKCCGDGVAPHVFDALASVGVHDAADGWAPVTRLELSRGDHGVERPLTRPVQVIPREVFDARLVAHAEAAGAVRRRHRVTSLRRVGEEMLLDEQIRARVVLGADGAQSIVRRWLLGRSARGRRAVALRGYVPTPESGRGRQLIRYADGLQPAYAWAFDRGDGLSNVGYGELVGQERPSRAHLLAQLERLIPGSMTDPRAFTGHQLPLSSFRWTQPDGPVLLAGDAASLINPMTGEGIYYAVATGILAGRAAAAGGDAGLAYRRAVHRLIGRHLRHTAVVAGLSDHESVVDAGITAARRSQRVFDELVEIGLGDGLVTPRLTAALLRAWRGPGHTPSMSR
ncbi:NAD(P)/FAD-dependent oxidoreductase [Nocardioides mangrovicus]|uniref:NAD(P)/FAD-dependent oxidoreductase n=1 Tax=Nocardioides mangrovicus TaxID=2478913 RepID=A0A3L8NYY2_9ACTN|nr:NAD(P)/FAD-dependent oxidoreductase [Nocardioides mangrovicus]RLV47867.1 NAD(P)/FAD-dependent oxidoreductase [Nocardioides mangrovicus]